MFERYTEKARQTIFFARSDAESLGASSVEPEHLLGALIRESHQLFHLAAPDLEALRRRLQEIIPEGELPGSSNPPLSDETKRVLAYAAEEAENMSETSHPHIGTEHLLLGLLHEPESEVARILSSCGIERSVLMQPPLPSSAVPEPPEDRGTLHALVDSLPEESLRAAKESLGLLQIWPQAVPWRTRSAVASGREGTNSADTEGAIINRSTSASRFESGEEVIETHRFHRGHEIVLIERLRLAEDGKTLSYTQEIKGPGGSSQQAFSFDIPPASRERN